jgi:hypothetical protein
MRRAAQKLRACPATKSDFGPIADGTDFALIAA